MVNFCFYWLPPLLLTVGVLFMSGEVGAVVKFRFPIRILTYLLPSYSFPEIINLYITLRKIGHFLAYAALFGVYVRAWRWHLEFPRLKAVILALAVCLLVATVDESRQAMIASRSGSPRDVLLDMSGALTAAIVLFPLLKQGSREKQ